MATLGTASLDRDGRHLVKIAEEMPRWVFPPSLSHSRGSSCWWQYLGEHDRSHIRTFRIPRNCASGRTKSSMRQGYALGDHTWRLPAGVLVTHPFLFPPAASTEAAQGIWPTSDEPLLGHLPQQTSPIQRPFFPVALVTGWGRTTSRQTVLE